MTVPDTAFSEMVAALEGHPDYRILRRLQYRDDFLDAGDQPTRIGILLEVETTGLDTSSDEVIELGMVKFSYLPTGENIDTFNSLNEPTKPIPPEATKLHGITDAMVAGHKIDDNAVDVFASEAVVVIAHNAGFDRRFAERYWPSFVDKAWACSVNNIDWREHGFEGSRLGYLLAGVGLFHQAQALSMIAERFSRFWLLACRPSRERRCRWCWNMPASALSEYGPSILRSTSKMS